MAEPMSLATIDSAFQSVIENLDTFDPGRTNDSVQCNILALRMLQGAVRGLCPPEGDYPWVPEISRSRR